MSKSSRRHLRNQANNNTSSSRANKQRATVNANPTAKESNEEAMDTRSKAAPTKTKAGENNEADTRDTRTREITEISSEINMPKTTKMANVLTSKEIGLGVAAIRTEMETEATDVLLRITTIVVRSTRCQRLIMTRTTVSSTLRTLSSSLK